MSEPSALTLAVIKTIKAIPHGRIATYQQVAELSGNAQAARGVVWILKTQSEKHSLPWQRVVRKGGQIAFPHGTSKFLLQRRLLRAEGVEVGRLGEIDVARFGWRRRPKRRPRARNQPKMFSD